jgi:hypothetical protein
MLRAALFVLSVLGLVSGLPQESAAASRQAFVLNCAENSKTAAIRIELRTTKLTTPTAVRLSGRIAAATIEDGSILDLPIGARVARSGGAWKLQTLRSPATGKIAAAQLSFNRNCQEKGRCRLTLAINIPALAHNTYNCTAAD